MSKNIYIDKTYVHFKKTKWKDAFIKEKSWNKLCKLIVDTNFLENASEYEERCIMESIAVLSITYLYQILCKYGYDVQYIDISIKQNSEFKVIYEIDDRKSWDN
jgi:hypothetical protein